MPTPAMLARLLFDAMNSRDFSELENYLAPNAVFDFPGAGSLVGSRRIFVFFKVLFRKYPRLVFNVTDMLIDGERACVVWDNEGESSVGETYRNSGMTLLRMANGRISFISDYFKDTSFAHQP